MSVSFAQLVKQLQPKSVATNANLVALQKLVKQQALQEKQPSTLEELQETHSVPGQFHKFFPREGFARSEATEVEARNPVKSARRLLQSVPPTRMAEVAAAERRKPQGKKLVRIEELLLKLIDSDFSVELETSRWRVTRLALSGNEKSCLVFYSPHNYQDAKECSRIDALLARFQPAVQKAFIGHVLQFNRWSAPLRFTPRLLFRRDKEWERERDLDAIMLGIEAEQAGIKLRDAGSEAKQT
ncbi:hypothetical protein HDV03_002171 [Kappamyces sp. JEL0829]|nr:hypothetical protein HDV03_002171 [Kappamyces sp. JEL0829]